MFVSSLHGSHVPRSRSSRSWWRIHAKPPRQSSVITRTIHPLPFRLRLPTNLERICFCYSPVCMSRRVSHGNRRDQWCSRLRLVEHETGAPAKAARYHIYSCLHFSNIVVCDPVKSFQLLRLVHIKKNFNYELSNGEILILKYDGHKLK